MDTADDAELALRRLLAAVEHQLQAARTANAASLVAATETRRSLQEALDVEVLLKLESGRREEIARVAAMIRSFDVRIRACGDSVLEAIASLAPDQGPSTYSRHAVLRRAS